MGRLRTRLPTVLGDLRSNGSFLRLLGGRLVTNAGDSLYYIGAMWLVFELTGSPLYTGLAGFLVRGPSALSFLTGPLVDRWPLRHVLVGTQLVNGALVLVIPVAAWTGHLSVWVVLGLLPFVTFVNQFVYPAQTAALPRMVDEDDLARANSLLSATYRGADMVFNAISGVLIALVGAVTLFVVDSATFAVAFLLFAGLTVTTAEGVGDREEAEVEEENLEATAEPEGYLGELREGFAYVSGSLFVALLGGVVVANFAAGAMLGVMPAFAATIGGPDAYGFLMAAYAGGSLAGTLIASRFDGWPFGRFAVASNVVSAAMLAAALLLPWFPATVGLLFLAFLPVGAFNVLFWTMLQSTVADGLLGRVSSLVSSAATVAIPVGSVVGGAIADAVGSHVVMFGWVAGSLAFALYVASRPGLRSLPEIEAIDTEMLRIGTGSTSGGIDDRPVAGASEPESAD